VGERVDQLVYRLGVFREELAVPVHELGERVAGVLATGVPGQQVIEVAEHLLEPPVGPRVGRAAHRVAGPGEPLFEHLLA
jgi:hypothetical protein